jgi:hypothetical protein
MMPRFDAIDFEVQVLADSVDFLKDLEIQAGTEQSPLLGEATDSTVGIVAESRDRVAASLSYDGRESDETLRHLSTLPMTTPGEVSFEPIVIETPWLGDNLQYIEFVHPEDVSRRLVRRSLGANQSSTGRVWIRYGLFGHDLEKGVLLRSRMRGSWERGLVDPETLQRRYHEFRECPLPLGP